MHYIIFDLEWNYGTDEEQGIGEIIELGAVKLNSRLETVDELGLYIKPSLYPKLHKRIASLTGIRDRDLAEKGIPFPEAYGRFLDWCGEDGIWMTWSPSDLPVLLDNLQLHELDSSVLPDYCDLQRIFGRELMRSDTRYALDTALAVLKETGEAAHDALHDARNTAKVCRHLELEAYLEEYTGRIFGLVSPDTRYESRRALLEEESLSVFPCPWCGEEVRCERWIPFGHNTLAAYGLCPEEDEFLLQLMPVSHSRGEHTARRLVFELTDDLWDLYLTRKENAQGVAP